jgi:hypothetical protein
MNISGEHETAHIFAFVAHHAHGMHQVYGVDIKHVHGFRLAAQALVVSGKAKQVADAQRVGPHDFGLKRYPVAVAGDHLHYRFNTHVNQVQARSQATHADDSGLVVGDVYGIDAALQYLPFFPYHAGVRSAGRAAFCRHGEPPA